MKASRKEWIRALVVSTGLALLSLALAMLSEVLRTEVCR
jgi:hypothetical protein